MIINPALKLLHRRSGFSLTGRPEGRLTTRIFKGHLNNPAIKFGVPQGEAKSKALIIYKSFVGKSGRIQDTIMNRLRNEPNIRCMLPGDAIAYLESWYEDRG